MQWCREESKKGNELLFFSGRIAIVPFPKSSRFRPAHGETGVMGLFDGELDLSKSRCRYTAYHFAMENRVACYLEK